MNIHKLTKDFGVSAQINAADVAEIAEAGYGTIICNRPDNEEPGQPNFAEIEAAANAAGVVVHYIPVGHAPLNEETVQAFNDAMQGAKVPVLAYCRSGARSANIFQACGAVRQ